MKQWHPTRYDLKFNGGESGMFSADAGEWVPYKDTKNYIDKKNKEIEELRFIQNNEYIGSYFHYNEKLETELEEEIAKREKLEAALAKWANAKCNNNEKLIYDTDQQLMIFIGENGIE